MPTKVNLHKLPELANQESPTEVLIQSRPDINLHIINESKRTIIKLPYGNKFDIINNTIVIHDS